MALGDQSKGLIEMSKARGWDPTVIPATDGKPAVDLTQFDAPARRPNSGDGFVGQVPDLKTAWPDGYDVNVAGPNTTTFNSPDVSRENKSRRTTNANPFPTQ